MSDIADTALAFFEAESWPVMQIENRSLLGMVFQGESGTWNCYAGGSEEPEQWVFYSVCPVSAPAANRAAVAELLTRANYGLVIGNFEMDFEDGEIRYKTGIDVCGDRLTPALIRQMVYANVATMDIYLPGILSVIYGDVSAAEAVAQVEKSMPHSDGRLEPKGQDGV